MQRRREKSRLTSVPLSAAALHIVKEEVERSSYRAVGKRLGLDHSTIACWVTGKRIDVMASTIDAVIATYTMARVLRTKAALRRVRP